MAQSQSQTPPLTYVKCQLGQAQLSSPPPEPHETQVTFECGVCGSVFQMNKAGGAVLDNQSRCVWRYCHFCWSHILTTIVRGKFYYKCVDFFFFCKTKTQKT